MQQDSGTGEIAALVHASIQAGLVPTEAPDTVWVGKGTGKTCDACGLPVTVVDIEYETDLPSGRTIRFHLPCFTVWHEERVKHPTS
jgi:hypothetical protein